MPVLTIEAPAKINLHLRVMDRRPDGFHDLESIFAALAFGDTLRFEPVPASGSLEIVTAGDFVSQAAIPVEKNIIYRAVSLFRSRTGYTRGLRILVEKRIPLGGGLGGGSSDAASALLALNTLQAAEGGSPPDAASLAGMAASLGSDVPFFLAETGAAWVRGRGERVDPFTAPEKLYFVLVNPGFASETAPAFRLLDEYRASCGAKPASTAPPAAELIRALAAAPRDWPFTNDFLPVFLRASGDAAAYQEILRQLRDLGADFVGLSGAGSTCFGVFTKQEQAAAAEATLAKTWNFVKCSFLLARRAIAVLE
jgi:4-diphosphocytidyl-2-C-methyl-D-erythritol kinase